MKINVISDLHFAKVWDDFDKVIIKNKLNYNFLNPNEKLRHLLKKLNSKDLLIFNGDVVDYFYSDYIKKDKSNWDLFLEVLKKYKGKYLLNLGNHDYRKKPYNFSIYGTRHVNLLKEFRKKNLNEIGFSEFRFFKELDSVSVNLEKYNPLKLNIFNQKTHIINKNQIILLNTGQDAFTNINSFLNIFRIPFLFSNNPLSKGLLNKDINFLKNNLLKDFKRNIIFLHNPPFFTKNKIPVLKLSKFRYFFYLFRYGLIKGTFIKNNWKFIKTLLNSNKNIIVITSHIHYPKQFIIDKKQKILRESSLENINKHIDNNRYIKFISTIPLGVISFDYKKIGYLEITNKKINYVIIDNF
jgi:hypothetical protein